MSLGRISTIINSLVPKREKIKIAKKAEIALNSLHFSDEERVKKLIEHLENFPNDKYINDFVHKIEGWESTYAIKANDFLRIIFRKEKEKIVIEDIINNENFLGDQ